MFGGSSSLKYERNDVTNTSSVLKSGGKLTLDSEQGNVAVVASKLDATGDIRLDADQGAIAIKARKDSRYERLEINKSNLLSFKIQDTGRIDETVIHTTMKTDGSIIIESAQGVLADYKISGNFEESTRQLAVLPGLEYIDQLKARSDVNWQGLSEAHDQWDYKAQGLGPGAAILISLAVAVASGGTGAGLIGAAENSLAATMANMAFDTLVSKAITSGINNGGDIGAVLKDLASMNTVKSLATSMLTAGVTSALKKKGADPSLILKAENKLTKNSAGDNLDYEITAIQNLGDNKAGVLNTSRVRAINSRVPINSQKYSGKTMHMPGSLGQQYPHGVPFSGAGYPDFSRYSQANVRIKLTGNRQSDFALANKAAGYSTKPQGMTWHHHQDAGYMQLVPTKLHRFAKHTGGMATSK